VPVISSNAGGLPELNVEGYTGFLRDVTDLDGMADQAVYILEDEERLNTFKENALNHARKFDLATILPQYENFYREVIAGSKPL